MKKV
jgi:hypothetical protein